MKAIHIKSTEHTGASLCGTHGWVTSNIAGATCGWCKDLKQIAERKKSERISRATVN